MYSSNNGVCVKMYNDPSCKPWTSHEWAPPGYSSRLELMKDVQAAEARKPLAKATLEEERVEDGDGDGMGKGRRDAPGGDERLSKEVIEGDGT